MGTPAPTQYLYVTEVDWLCDIFLYIFWESRYMFMYIHEERVAWPTSYLFIVLWGMPCRCIAIAPPARRLWLPTWLRRRGRFVQAQSRRLMFWRLCAVSACSAFWVGSGKIRTQRCILVRGVVMDVFDASDHCMYWAGLVECGLIIF